MHGDDNLAASKAIRESLKELDNGIGEKMSITRRDKMLIVTPKYMSERFLRCGDPIFFKKLCVGQ